MKSRERFLYREECRGCGNAVMSRTTEANHPTVYYDNCPRCRNKEKLLQEQRREQRYQQELFRTA